MEIALLPYAFPIFVFLIFYLIMYAIYDLCLKAKILRANLKMQGVDGPAPSFVLGNIPDIQKIKSKVSAEGASTYNLNEPLSLDCRSLLLPHISQWTKQFGKTFTFALGKVQILYIGDGELVREMSLCKSLDLGKPSYMQKDRGPLLGKGVLTTSKEVWAHHRKSIAPTLYVDKVKNMYKIVLESGNTLVKSWEKLVETAGGTADIRVDDHVKKFTSSIFSNVMFGRYDVATKGMFSKCRDLMEASGSPTALDGRPFYRFFPTKRNREQWRLEKEIYRSILEIAKKCSSESESMIQTLVEGSKHGELGSSTPQQFIADNCKELCIVAMDVPGITGIWGLMLLALHPEWQARARAEVLQVCGGQIPDAEKLGKMRVLKMIIQEILRLYPGVGFTVREALADVQIGNKVCVPKGVNTWIWPIALHRDPQLWGPDALEFNPERFSNGVAGACKIPQAYIPFGLGPRTCLGMNLGMMELKVMFSLVLANFSFSLSPNYHHVPKFDVLLEPKYGVNLVVHKL